MLSEAGVELVFAVELQDVTVDSANHAITSISVTTADRIDGNGEQVAQEYTANVFIDASYEGDLMAAAGVSFVVGREAVSDFNESLAGFVVVFVGS